MHRQGVIECNFDAQKVLPVVVGLDSLHVARFNNDNRVEHRDGLFHWNTTVSKFHLVK